MDFKNAQLILEDGTTFSGKAFGYAQSVSGEVVFNTGMVGYPESFTDPSYRGQILALTYPLIGNYGVPPDIMDNGLEKHFESDNIHISGLVISSLTQFHNHWNSSRSLDEWLAAHKVPGIHGIDTRALTKKLREHGVMLGKIVIGDDVAIEDPNKRNLVAEVSTKKKIVYNEGAAARILLLDCGVKNNIIRSLIQRHVTVVRVPWDYHFLGDEYDGIVISNGPGDPKMCTTAIHTIAQAMEGGTPIFGICLGNQLMALAAGGDTYKLKYGHRGQNQPCISGERCYITSQNHGFAVNAKSLGSDWEELFVNANDGTNEGLRHSTKPFMSAQFHPEGTPGPVDTAFLFDTFLEMVKHAKG
ncbi:MAG: glutamine-hydrolyzing carbamoyl-phosphate synthase small subunit [Candidatus Aenigmarchaeota archaeon]|nr:glutamine-hydrolyzing carbamoyl-phosphate synthase small subunit [Candidatus Aenigmarchaeota archaeon]